MDSKTVSIRRNRGGYGSLTLPVKIQRALGNPKKFHVSLEDGAVVYRPTPVDDEG